MEKMTEKVGAVPERIRAHVLEERATGAAVVAEGPRVRGVSAVHRKSGGVP